MQFFSHSLYIYNSLFVLALWLLLVLLLLSLPFGIAVTIVEAARARIFGSVHIFREFVSFTIAQYCAVLCYAVTLFTAMARNCTNIANAMNYNSIPPVYLLFRLTWNRVVIVMNSQQALKMPKLKFSSPAHLVIWSFLWISYEWICFPFLNTSVSQDGKLTGFELDFLRCK